MCVWKEDRERRRNTKNFVKKFMNFLIAHCHGWNDENDKNDENSVINSSNIWMANLIPKGLIFVSVKNLRIYFKRFWSFLNGIHVPISLAKSN